MSEEIEAIKNAIDLNRSDLLERLLSQLGIEEINENEFEALVEIIEESDILYFKYKKALESQEIVEDVLKNKLI